MTNSEDIDAIATEAMKQVLALDVLGNSLKYGGRAQASVFEAKRNLHTVISKLWKVSSKLRMEEQRGTND